MSPEKMQYLRDKRRQCLCCVWLDYCSEVDILRLANRLIPFIGPEGLDLELDTNDFEPNKEKVGEEAVMNA